MEQVVQVLKATLTVDNQQRNAAEGQLLQVCFFFFVLSVAQLHGGVPGLEAFHHAGNTLLRAQRPVDLTTVGRWARFGLVSKPFPTPKRGRSALRGTEHSRISPAHSSWRIAGWKTEEGRPLSQLSRDGRAHSSHTTTAQHSQLISPHRTVGRGPQVPPFAAEHVLLSR
jgi:hypothetical protein